MTDKAELLREPSVAILECGRCHYRTAVYIPDDNDCLSGIVQAHAHCQACSSDQMLYVEEM